MSHPLTQFQPYLALPIYYGIGWSGAVKPVTGKINGNTFQRFHKIEFVKVKGWSIQA